MQNQLSQALSPYLRQHAHQPVAWQMWSKETLALAQTVDKPIFLSIGYATCHWCHVMAHESFDDPDIAKLINDNFIPIKVDREEYPDIDHLYMTAVTSMTSQGGWPLNVFLTPQAKPFYGGTYFAPRARYGLPGFKDVLLSMADYWAHQRQQVTDHADRLVEHIQELMIHVAQEIKLSEAITTAYHQLSSQQDKGHGGFGGAPKFPTAHPLIFMLTQAVIRHDQAMQDHVIKTLINISQGGICDHLAGGFHRYSVDDHWHVPHFEKMLYDQAGLLTCYVYAYQLTNDAHMAEIAKQIADFMLEDLQSPTGGFYTAWDADSQDEQGHWREGAFYVFTKEEIDQCLAEKAELFNLAFGVTSEGNVIEDPQGEFVGQNVLYRAKSDHELAVLVGLSPAEIRAQLKDSIQRLKELRAQRLPPLRDEKILMDQNGMAIEALALAGAVLDESRYIESAIRAADFVYQNFYQQGKWRHRYFETTVSIEAILDDKVFLAKGLLMLSAVTQNSAYQQTAFEIVNDIIVTHINEQGYCLTHPLGNHDLPCAVRDLHDGAYMSANSALIGVLYQCWMLTAKSQYQECADKIIKSYGGLLAKQPSSLTAMLLMAGGFEAGGYKVLINAQDKALFVKRRNLLYKEFNPWLVISHDEQIKHDQVAVCSGHQCLAPVDIQQLRIGLSRMKD